MTEWTRPGQGEHRLSLTPLSVVGLSPRAGALSHTPAAEEGAAAEEPANVSWGAALAVTPTHQLLERASHSQRLMSRSASASSYTQLPIGGAGTSPLRAAAAAAMARTRDRAAAVGAATAAESQSSVTTTALAPDIKGDEAHSKALSAIERLRHGECAGSACRPGLLPLRQR
jgi:hypothetical protein